MIENDCDLPKGWIRVTLDEIVLNKAKKTTPNGSISTPFIGMDSIQPGSLTITTVYNFANYKSAGNQFEKGDILYGRMRPYLNKVCITPFNGVASGEFLVLQPKKVLSAKYLQLLLHSLPFVSFASSITTGDRPRVAFENIKDYSIHLPPLAEQERIVAKIEELFSSLDKGIESLKAAQAQLKVYRQAVLKQAFEGRLTNTGVKDGELPEGWKSDSIGSLLNSIHGGTTCVPTSSKTDYPVLRSSSIRPGNIDYTDVRYISELDFLNNTSMVDDNDLLFTRLNGTVDYVGNCARVTKGFPKNLLYPDRIYCAKVRILEYAKYLELYFQTPSVRKHIENRAKSTAGHKRISIPDITELTIPIPEENEVNEIVKIIEYKFSACDKLEESIERSLKQAEALRQSILKKAFEGHLVPQAPNDESAAVLLERIRAEREAAAQETGRKRERKPRPY